MQEGFNQNRFKLAADRFRAFFDELKGVFFERDDVLAQIALALLGREHVLMTGPPGTAKSQIAAGVLGRILDESTGAPSLFSRQFTESTVQTDLIGPLNFKTLMSTGRTEHFTDEGMLGAIHAFLDEVLDGRDMLLRSTLNVLNERELKQGTKTTRGMLECALMTSNRYLSEVLEGSRETLLAFVDRVAYISFVPRGFGDPNVLTEVLRRQVAGMRQPALRSPLTIQDLDVLQAATDSVYVPTSVCDSLCTLLGTFEKETAAAFRSDPNFLPTRYLSTRTAVRTGKILRSICVYDRIFHDAQRPMRVRHEDLELTRLTLLLSGPPKEHMGAFIAKETDAREKRQLIIIRTERDLFDQCYRKLIKPATAATNQAKSRSTEYRRQLATASGNSKSLLDLLTRLLDEADTGDDSNETSELLDQVSNELLRLAVSDGLSREIRNSASIWAMIQELSAMADGLESVMQGSRPLVSWLRGRVVQIIDEAAGCVPTSSGSTLSVIAEEKAPAKLLELAENKLSTVEKLANQRADLVARGAILNTQEPHDGQPNVWFKAASIVEDDLTLIWDTALREQSYALSKTKQADLTSALLKVLFDRTSQLDSHTLRLSRLGTTRSQLKYRVMGPRLAPLLKSYLIALYGEKLTTVLNGIQRLINQLDQAKLRRAIAREDLFSWSIGALLSAQEPNNQPVVQRSVEAYRTLRQQEQRTSMLFSAIEVALIVMPIQQTMLTSENEIPSTVVSLIQSLPNQMQQTIVSRDIQRLKRMLAFFESWWAEISNTSAPTQDDNERTLKRIVNSGFFTIAHDEGALARFMLEGKLMSEVFASSASEVNQLVASFSAIFTSSLETTRSFENNRSEDMWQSIFNKAQGS